MLFIELYFIIMNSRILILSDTHWSESYQIPSELEYELSRCDSVIHCGDFASVDILNTISAYTSLFAVCGNCDDFSVRKFLPQERFFNLNGVNIGLIHGVRRNFSYIYELHSKFTGADLVIFGHTHIPLLEKIDNTVFFNPGSFTYPRDGNSPSIGVLNINESGFSLEHVFF